MKKEHAGVSSARSTAVADNAFAAIEFKGADASDDSGSGKPKNQTFRGWLRQQRHRDDATGDVARDCIIDIRRGHLPRKCRSAAEIEEHIITKHPMHCDSAIDALREAAREYDGERSH